MKDRRLLFLFIVFCFIFFVVAYKFVNKDMATLVLQLVTFGAVVANYLDKSE